MDVLITEAQIQERVRELGHQIEADYHDKPLTIVAVLTGSLILLADLIREIRIPLRVALLQASSYKGATTQAGVLVINEAFAPDVIDRDVLLLDDILDTGHTLGTLVSRMSARGARSVRTAVLLRKIGRQEVHLEPDYCGFTIPDAFVVGYGLDFNDDYRHLPYVAVLDGSVGVKIALVTRRYPPLIGGAERVLSYLAPALAWQGADVAVLTSEAYRQVELPPPAPIGLIRLHAPPIRVLGTWIYMRSLRAWFKRNHVDLAYVSMLKHDAYVALGAGRKHGFPVVLRPEGAGATGDIAWQSWGRFGRMIAKRCKRADAVVAISEAIEQELRAAGYRDDQIVRIPNGVPIPETAWSPRPNWQVEPRAVFVGRLAPEKSLETLIDAWKLVRQVHPTAMLAIVGEGPDRPRRLAHIERLALTHAIELPGPSPHPAEILLNSDLFVLPSREEGMSIALLEAMSLGIPVVASGIPGNRALVTDHKHGRLFTPGDPAALARAILEHWAAPENSARMGAAARDRVREEYSIAAVAKRHFDLFERLVRARARR